MKELSPKSPAERVPVTFDFSQQMAEAESLMVPTLSVRAIRGIDADPSTLLYGAPAIVGQVVQQLVEGGVLGERYEITCSATTSYNQILNLVAVQPVRDPADT